MFDLAIKSNYTVTPGKVKPAVVLIKKGKIADIVHPLPSGINCPIIDAGELPLLPGVVDTHVHINEPGRTDWEGFDTATRSALAGGVTTLVDMPLNSLPVTTTLSGFNAKLGAANLQLHAHCGFWGGVIPGNEHEIEALANAGVLGFKAFLTHSGIEEFPNVTEYDLRRAMPLIARHDLPLLVHCELAAAVAGLETTEPRSYRQYLASRPPSWEHKAVKLMIRLCAEYRCRVHIVHLSSSGSLELIRKAKGEGLPLTCETAQHYLYFNSESIADGHTQFKCAPPIREKSNNELLWQGLEDGTIDFVATDHSPAPLQLKELQSGNFMKAWGGIASLQFALPSLWTAAKSRGLGLLQLARWLCEKPAELAGLHNRKGKIQAGFDADLVLFDPQQSFRVTEPIIRHKHKITPYLNEELTGTVEQSFLLGSKVFENGSFVRLNQGNILTRDQ